MGALWVLWGLPLAGYKALNDVFESFVVYITFFWWLFVILLTSYEFYHKQNYKVKVKEDFIAEILLSM